jgi:hypothetical protein
MESSAPISLYLDLAEGESANLEVVARAALAWSSAIKELAYVIDPSAEVEIDLISGSEGSLGLNACVKAFSKIKGKHPQITTIIVTSLAWFALQTGQYTYTKVLDWLTGKTAPPIVANLTDAQIQELARDVVKAQEGNVAGPQRRQVFRELEQDKSIVGVGATQKTGQRPAVIIPRSEFAIHFGDAVITPNDTPERRTRRERMDVVLVTPTLKDAERRWRFQLGSLPEFGATMKDHEFLQALSEGRVALPLRTGIHMDIELETKEELAGLMWEARERNVIKVHSPKVLNDPNQLPFVTN